MPCRATRPVRAQRPASIRSAEPSSPVRPPRAPRTPPRPLGDAAGSEAPREDGRGAVGEDLHRRPSWISSRMAGEPRPRGDPEDPEADLHPLVEAYASSVRPRRRVEAVDVELRERPLRQTGPAPHCPAPRRIDRDHVGRQLVDQPGHTLGADLRHDAHRHATVVHQHEVETFADTDVDPERAHRRRSRPTLAGEEL